MIKVVHTVDANTLRDTVQDANLNFLVGAGASAQLFRCLGDIENLLAALDDLSDDDDAGAVARASVYAEYFTEVLYKNIELLEHATSADPLRASYQSFMRALNQILIRRRSTMLNKQVNIYTTNVDLAFEDTGEILGLNMNDGFSGRFLPRFSTTNFGAVTSRRSLQYENLSQVPTFNLYKLHGSVGWVAAADDTVITFESSLAELRAVGTMLDTIRADLVSITNATSAGTLLVDAALSFVDPAAARSFLKAYERLPVVNPRKTKFQQTVMNQNYYDLLRIFTNELEKENSVLFLIGFSCRDEHIRELLLRACRSNPTLQVYVFAYEHANIEDFESVFAGQVIPNSNLQIVAPEQEADPDKADRFSLGRITEKFLAPIAPTPTVPAPVAPSGTSA